VIAAPPPDPTTEQRRLLLEQVEGTLRVQADAFDAMDRKVATVVAATGFLLGLVINNADHFAKARDGVTLVFYLALIALAAAFVVGLSALWPREIGLVPEPEPFLQQHATRLPADTLGELVSTKALVYGNNREVSQSKFGLLRWQTFLLAVGGVLLVSAYVLERLAP
jgi:hypothetical protein